VTDPARAASFPRAASRLCDVVIAGRGRHHDHCPFPRSLTAPGRSAPRRTDASSSAVIVELSFGQSSTAATHTARTDGSSPIAERRFPRSWQYITHAQSMLVQRYRATATARPTGSRQSADQSTPGDVLGTSFCETVQPCAGHPLTSTPHPDQPRKGRAPPPGPSNPAPPHDTRRSTTRSPGIDTINTGHGTSRPDYRKTLRFRVEGLQPSRSCG
jgi:hypothetical protein